MTRSSPICAEPYADMVRKRHIAEGTDFDAEHRAQEMWSLLYSLTRIMNGASQRLYRGDDLKNRELVQPNVEILHDAKSITLLARVEEQCIHHVDGVCFSIEGTNKPHLMERRTLQSQA